MRLSAFQDGELGLQPARQLKQHLENCAPCRAELEALNQVVDSMKCMSPIAVEPAFPALIMSALQARPQRGFRLLPSLAYTLALLMIFVSGFLLEMSANGQPPSAPQPVMTFSTVLTESRNLGLLAVQDSTLELFSGGLHEN